MSHRILLDVTKNSRESLRVTVSEFHGRQYVHVRNWFEPREGGEKQPGKEGVAFTAEHIPAVVDALQRAAGELEGVVRHVSAQARKAA